MIAKVNAQRAICSSFIFYLLFSITTFSQEYKLHLPTIDMNSFILDANHNIWHFPTYQTNYNSSPVVNYLKRSTNQWQKFEVKAKLRSHKLSAYSSNENGDVFFVYTLFVEALKLRDKSYIFMASNDTIKEIGIPRKENKFIHTYVKSIHCTSDGSLWVGSQYEGLCNYEGDNWTIFNNREYGINFEYFGDKVIDPNSKDLYLDNFGLTITDKNGKLYLFIGKDWYEMDLDGSNSFKELEFMHNKYAYFTDDKIYSFKDYHIIVDIFDYDGNLLDSYENKCDRKRGEYVPEAITKAKEYKNGDIGFFIKSHYFALYNPEKGFWFNSYDQLEDSWVKYVYPYNNEYYIHAQWRNKRRLFILSSGIVHEINLEHFDINRLYTPFIYNNSYAIFTDKGLFQENKGVLSPIENINSLGKIVKLSQPVENTLVFLTDNGKLYFVNENTLKCLNDSFDDTFNPSKIYNTKYDQYIGKESIWIATNCGMVEIVFK